jgi:hypothetical protein
VWIATGHNYRRILQAYVIQGLSATCKLGSYALSPQEIGFRGIGDIAAMYFPLIVVASQLKFERPCAFSAEL